MKTYDFNANITPSPGVRNPKLPILISGNRIVPSGDLHHLLQVVSG